MPHLSLPTPQNLEAYRGLQSAPWFWAITLFALQLAQDGLHAAVQGYSYYLSEDAVFAAGWLLMWPAAALLRSLSEREQLRPSAAVSNWTWWLIAAASHFALAALGTAVLASLFLEVEAPLSVTLDYMTSNQVTLFILAYAALFATRKSPQSVLSDQSEYGVVPYSQRDIVIKEGTTIQRVAVDDILFVTVDRPYLAIHTAQRRWLHTDTLHRFAEQTHDRGFLQIHRSTLVRMSAVVKVESRGNGDYEVYLEGGHSLRLSRRFRKTFLDAYAPDSARQ